MLKAVIDLGTNTFNLLVFDQTEGKPIIVYNDRVPVGLGMGGINQSLIAEEAFLRGVSTMRQFKMKCDEMSVTQIKAFGTSALRGASNKLDFIQEVSNQTGITIEAIEGEREAALIYNGVRNVHVFKKSSCVMDIGGGSTEFILVNQEAAIMNSFDIGVARILQFFNLSDPLSDSDLSLISHFFDERTGGFFIEHNSDVLVGSSGSFETFYELIFDAPFTDLWKSTELPFQLLLEVLDKLIYTTLEEREKNPQITDLRKNMIHIAAFKTKWVIEKLGISEVWLSPASLKEGVMFEQCNNPL